MKSSLRFQNWQKILNKLFYLQDKSKPNDYIYPGIASPEPWHPIRIQDYQYLQALLCLAQSLRLWFGIYWCYQIRKSNAEMHKEWDETVDNVLPLDVDIQYFHLQRKKSEKKVKLWRLELYDCLLLGPLGWNYFPFASF